MKKLVLFLLCFTLGFGCGVSMIPPKITVLLPTYNRANRFMPRAVDSILKQTFKNFELLIINDGSSDNTAEVLAEMAKKDSRIRVINNEQNIGLVATLNKGIKLARGKYIARMDDDDFSLADRLEKQYAFMEAHPDITVVAGWVSRPNTDIPWPFQRQITHDEIVSELYLGKAPISHPVSFIRKDFLLKNHIEYDAEYKSAEDRPFWFDIVEAGGRFASIPEVLLQYRIHGSNKPEYYATQSKNTGKFFTEKVLKKFGITPQSNRVITHCFELYRVATINEQWQFVNPSVLRKAVFQQCPLIEENALLQDASETFVFENQLVYAKNQEIWGKVLQKTSTDLQIEWHGGETLNYQKSGDVWVQKQ